MSSSGAVVPAVAAQQKILADLEHTIERAREELAHCDRQVHSAEAAYREAEQHRLSGVTNGAASGDLRRTLVAARIEQALVAEGVQDLRRQHREAHAHLAQAQAVAAREAAVQEWNTLAAQADTACRRVEKGLRAVVSGLEKLQHLARDQTPHAATAGYAGVDWLLWAKRTLTHLLLCRLRPLGLDLAPPNRTLVDQLEIGTKHLWDVCPFAHPLREPEPAGSDDTVPEE
jgi:hypothetical protein